MVYVARGERARRHVVHDIARTVDAHDIEAGFMPRQDHLERALDAARDAEGTRHVVGRSAREIAELHVPLADALQDAVEGAVSPRKEDDVVHPRAVARVRGHVLPALGGDDVNMVEMRPQRPFDITDAFGDLSLAAPRMI